MARDTEGTLEPGDTVTASATYELTADDLENGSVVNLATATGDAPGGDPSFATNATVTLELSPGLTIDKTGTLNTAVPPVEGDTITFDFTVVNTGNVPLTDVAIDDQLDGLGTIDYTWPGATDGRIGIGESMTATATYTLTQEDIDAGFVVNTATANGDAPGGDTATGTDVTQVDLPADPELTLSKTSDFESDEPMAGDEVTFDFTVENTGNVTVNAVDIADDLAGISGIVFGTWPGNDGELLPGDSVTAMATYELTQEDIDAGELVNEATASGEAVRGGDVTADADVTVELTQVPGLELVKTANTDTAGLGDVIEFTIVGTNTGNTTLIEVAVADELPGLSALAFEWPGDEGVLAPGEAVTITATYTVVNADVQTAKVVNTATATAVTLGEASLSESAEASVVIYPPDVPLAFTGTRGTLLTGSIALVLLGGGLALILALRIRRRAAWSGAAPSLSPPMVRHPNHSLGSRHEAPRAVGRAPRRAHGGDRVPHPDRLAGADQLAAGRGVRVRVQPAVQLHGCRTDRVADRPDRVGSAQGLRLRLGGARGLPRHRPQPHRRHHRRIHPGCSGAVGVHPLRGHGGLRGHDRRAHRGADRQAGGEAARVRGGLIVAKAILIQVLIGTVLGIVICSLSMQLIGNNIQQSVMLGPLFFLTAAGLAILGWALVLSLFRRRLAPSGPGGRVGWSFLAAVFAAIFNVVVGGIVGTIIGGGDPFVIVFVLLATGAFGIGALIANVLTNLAIARPAPKLAAG